MGDDWMLRLIEGLKLAQDTGIAVREMLAEGRRPAYLGVAGGVSLSHLPSAMT